MKVTATIHLPSSGTISCPPPRPRLLSPATIQFQFQFHDWVHPSIVHYSPRHPPVFIQLDWNSGLYTGGRTRFGESVTNRWTKVGPAFRDTLQIARLGRGHQQRGNLMRYATLMIKVTSSKMEKRGRERRVHLVHTRKKNYLKILDL